MLGFHNFSKNYYAVLPSVQHNPVIKLFYQHLVAQGKHRKVGLTACIRKLLLCSMCMLRDGKRWNEQMAWQVDLGLRSFVSFIARLMCDLKSFR